MCRWCATSPLRYFPESSAGTCPGTRAGPIPEVTRFDEGHWSVPLLEKAPARRGKRVAAIVIRVLLILSCARRSRRIRRQLAEEGDIEARYQPPETWSDIVTALEDFAPSVVVLDRGVLNAEGVSVAGDIARGERPPAVVLLADAYDPKDVLPAAKAGVRGYVVDAAGGVSWAAVVRAVAAGGGWLAPAAAGKLLDEFRARHGIGCRNARGFR